MVEGESLSCFAHSIPLGDVDRDFPLFEEETRRRFSLLPAAFRNKYILFKSSIQRRGNCYRDDEILSYVSHIPGNLTSQKLFSALVTNCQSITEFTESPTVL